MAKIELTRLDINQKSTNSNYVFGITVRPTVVSSLASKARLMHIF
jgi:hypothetical protein